MTKHSDYFVWKDTSERVARCCDDTVDKKRVKSCVLKQLFSEGVEQPKISSKTRKCSLRRATIVTFWKFLGWRRQKRAVFFYKKNCASCSFDWLIHLNLFGAKDSEKLFSSLQFPATHAHGYRTESGYSSQAADRQGSERRQPARWKRLSIHQHRVHRWYLNLCWHTRRHAKAANFCAGMYGLVWNANWCEENAFVCIR